MTPVIRSFPALVSMDCLSRTELLSVSDVEQCIASRILPSEPPVDLIGVEVESFPIEVKDCLPVGRLPLEGEGSVLAIVDGVAAETGVILPRCESGLRHDTTVGGAITYEPGGQVEYSSSPRTTVSDVMAEVTTVWQELSAAFENRNAALVGIGVDPWSKAGDIPQQLTIGRYQAMAAHLECISPAGAVMMRNSCSIQVNLDFGVSSVEDRWTAANLISPILTAMFASSPDRNHQSSRAAAWQRLDPSRTGFPDWTAGRPGVVEDTTRRALRAEVIYTQRDNCTVAAGNGMTFGDWLENGWPIVGPPTSADLESHLSTLFTEVRPRKGVFELRGIDALPSRWWSVPMVIASAVLYDERALGRTIERLEGWASRLDQIWRASARRGLGDEELATAAKDIAEIALETATGRPAVYDETSLGITQEFVERLTSVGRSPADEMTDLRLDPGAVLEWATPDSA